MRFFRKQSLECKKNPRVLNRTERHSRPMSRTGSTDPIINVAELQDIPMEETSSGQHQRRASGQHVWHTTQEQHRRGPGVRHGPENTNGERLLTKFTSIG